MCSTDPRIPAERKYHAYVDNAQRTSAKCVRVPVRVSRFPVTGGGGFSPPPLSKYHAYVDIAQRTSAKCVHVPVRVSRFPVTGGAGFSPPPPLNIPRFSFTKQYVM